MATDVETLLVKLEARITDFEKKMGQAERRASSGARKIQSSFNAIPGIANKALGLIGVGVGVSGFLKIIKSSIAAGEAVGDLADKLGVGTEALQELTFVAEQNGASQEDIAAGFRGMTRFLGEASRGSKEATAVLGQLGLTFDQLKSKSPAEVFEILLDRIGKIGNPLQRNAELMKVFGKAGTSLAQVAQLGSRGIDQLRDSARSLGVVMSDETVRAMQSMGDELDVIRGALVAAGAQVSAGFQPVLEELADFLTSPEFQSALKGFAQQLADFVKQTVREINLLIDLANQVKSVITNPGGVRLFTPEERARLKAGEPIDKVLTPSAGATVLGGGSANKGDEVALQRVKRAADDAVDSFDQVGDSANKSGEKAARAIENVEKKLTHEGEQLRRTARDQEIFNAVNDAGVDISSAAGRSIADQAAANYDLAQAIQASTERMDLFRDAARSGLSTFISDVREGKSVIDALGDAMDRILDRLLDFALDQVVAGLLGPSGSLGGGLLSSLIPRASGGSVSRGQALLVGERGPEIFVPRTAGVIGAPRGGGIKVETHYHNSAGVRVTEQQTPTKQGVRLDVMIDEIVASKGMDPSSKTGRMLAVRGAGPIRR